MKRIKDSDILQYITSLKLEKKSKTVHTNKLDEQIGEEIVGYGEKHKMVYRIGYNLAKVSEDELSPPNKIEYWNIIEYDKEGRIIYEQTHNGGWEVTNYYEVNEVVVETMMNSLNHFSKISFKGYHFRKDLMSYEDHKRNWWDIKYMPDTECPFHDGRRKLLFWSVENNHIRIKKKEERDFVEANAREINEENRRHR